MRPWQHRAPQMSDSLLTVACLTVSGGFQDAYTFYVRGQVFANAQTGNIVLFSEHLFRGDWAVMLRYLVPVMAFALGVWAAERVRVRYRHLRRVHWRQWIVLLEIAILAAVGLMPETLNAAANAMISFACAMQVQAFRKVNGSAVASTMCIGNLRSMMETWDAYLRTRDRALLRTALRYLAVLSCFALGAGLGSLLAPLLGTRAIWVSCAWLVAGFALMAVRDRREASPPPDAEKGA